MWVDGMISSSFCTPFMAETAVSHGLKRRSATADLFTNHSSTNARVEHAETPDWLLYYIRFIFVVNLLYFTCPKTKHVSTLWHIDRSIGLEQVRMIHWNLEFSSQNTMILDTFEPLDG